MPYLASVSLSSWRSDRISFTLQDSNGNAVNVYLFGTFSAEGIPSTLGQVSGLISNLLLDSQFSPLVSRQWRDGLDLQTIFTFDSVAELSALPGDRRSIGFDDAPPHDDLLGGDGNDLPAGYGDLQRLYQAAFDRQPDEAGLDYWLHELGKGFDLRDVASGFLASAEFVSRFGDDLSDHEFIDALYQNVLHREADQAGFDYWEAELASGHGRENVLLSFAESPENQADVILVIADGILYENWDPIGI